MITALVLSLMIQTPYLAPAETSVTLRLPVIEGVQSAPDCGGLFDLAGRATCMTTPLGNVGAAANLYMAALPQAGWTHLGGGDNRAVFQHARTDAGCDVLEMIIFYDTSLPQEALATAQGYLGFALHTRDDCLPAEPLEGEGTPQP